MDMNDLERQMSDISVISENESTYVSIIKWNIPKLDFTKSESVSNYFLIGSLTRSDFRLKLRYTDANTVHVYVEFCYGAHSAWLEGKITLTNALNSKWHPFSYCGKEFGAGKEITVASFQSHELDMNKDPMIKCFIKMKLREIKCKIDNYEIQRIESRNYDLDKKYPSVNDFLCDVMILVEDWNISAHKCMLAKIPFFRNLFDRDQSKKSFHLTNIDAAIMENVINYLYTEEILELNFKLACKLYVVTSDLEMCDLKNICSSYLGANLTEENVFIVYALSVEENDICLKKKCIEFIKASDCAQLTKDSVIF